MTDEEKQRVILELEREIPKSRAEREPKCEVCGNKFVKGDCPEHPVHIRMHHNYLQRVSRQYQ